MSQLKPLMLIDVDGVINILSENLRQFGDDLMRVCVPRSDGFTFNIHFRRSLVDKINGWSQRIEILWLTCWGKFAKEALSPALGLNPFDVAWIPGIRTDNMCQHGEHKRNSVLYFAQRRYCTYTVLTLYLPLYFAQHSNRPIIWIDDHITSACRMTVNDDTANYLMHRPCTLFINPTSTYGLLPAHEHIIDDFLSNPYDKQVHASCELYKGSTTISRIDEEVRRLWWSPHSTVL